MTTSAPPHLLRASPDHHLLVTRATILDPQALPHLLSCAARIAQYHPTPFILVGATRCPTTGHLSTSALTRTAPGSRTYTRLTPTLACLPADSFDPNCLLIPNALLPLFQQNPRPSLVPRLRRHGVHIFLAPHYVGTCPKPPPRRRPSRRRPGFACKSAI